MEQENPLMFKALLTVKGLWKISLYQSYRGLYGIFSLVYAFVAVLHALIIKKLPPERRKRI